MNRKHMSLVVSGVIALGCWLSGAAKTCTWLGGSGNWNDPEKWDGGEAGIPVANDEIVLTAADAAAAITNNLGEITLKSISFTGAEQVTLCGDKITVSCAGYRPTPWQNDASVQIEAPLAFTATGTESTYYFNANATFNGDVEMSCTGNAVRFTPASGKSATFNGSFTDVNPNGSTVWVCGSGALNFYGAVTMGTFDCNHGYATGTLDFYSSGNLIGKCVCNYSGKINLHVANALADTTILSFGSQDYNAAYYQLSADQCADRITGKDPPSDRPNTYQIVAMTANTLTLYGSTDAACSALLDGKQSVIWDPHGDFTQIFSNRVHTTTGTITVKRGAVVSAGSNSFGALTGLVCAGGTFVNDTSTANALAGLTKVELSQGGVLRLTERSAATPFGTAKPALTMARGTAIEIPTDVSISVGTAFVAGIYPANGTYTGKGFGEGDVKEVDWIVGGGRVTVTGNANYTSWINPEGGDWGEAANWSNGLPSDGKTNYIGLEGDETPIEITLAEGDVLPNKLTLVGPTARVVVPKNQTVTLDGDGRGTCAYKILDGAEFRVEGGTVVFTNYVGTFELAGTASATGRIAVTGGLFRWAPAKEYAHRSYEMSVRECGEIAVSGGTFQTLGIQDEYSVTEGELCFYGGKASVSGTGTFDRANLHTKCRAGEYRFTGEAVWSKSVSGNYVLCPETAGEKLTMTFLGHSYISGDSNGWTLGGTAGTESILTIDSDGEFSKFNYTISVESGATFNLLSGDIAVGQRGFDVGGRGGVANLTGGSLSVTGGWSDNNKAMGVLVGYGAKTSVREGRPFSGLLNLGGCAVTNSSGSTLVGTGYATGTWVQVGGVFRHESTSRILGVGVAGAVGSLTISNGLFSVANTTYLGGAFTNSFPNGNTYVPNGWPIDRHDAEGTLTFVGGTFSAEKDLILGADGHGMVERIGADGSFTTKNLILSNAVEDVTAGGTLKFTAVDGAIAPLTVTDNLFVGAGAELVVDVGETAPSKSQRLLTAKTVEGDFDKVQLLGSAAKEVKIVKDVRGWKLSRQIGLLLMVR